MLKMLFRLLRRSSGQGSNYPKGKVHNVPMDQQVRSQGSGSNDDIIAGYKFHATLSLHTPLKYLEQDGVVKKDWTDEERDIPARYGCLIPQVIESLRLDIPNRTRASPIGPVNIDGGDLLPALKRAREIIEAPSDARESLTVALNRCKEIQALPTVGMGSNEYLLLIIEKLSQKKIPHLNADHYSELSQQGLSSIDEILLLDQSSLTRLKGIGPKKAAAILNIDKKM